MGGQMRYLECGEEKKARNLWSAAFPEDSEAFKDYYFEKKAKKSRILVKEENGEIFAMLHRNPYLLRLGEQERKLDYIVGVATAPDRRRQGHMRDLLLRALLDARKEGQAFCFLMPAAEAIYSPFGFRFIYDQAFLAPEEETPEYMVSRKALEETDFSELSSFMEQWMKARYEVYTVRDEAYVKELAAELASENGVLERWYTSDGKLGGLRAFWGLEEREQRFLYWDGKTREVKPSKPAIMARIASVKELLRLARLEPGTEKIEGMLWIEDPLIKENRGLWKWKLEAGGAEAEREDKATAAAGEYFSCNVSQLAQWFFGYREWDQLLPGQAIPGWMDRIKRLKRICLDEVV